MDDRDPSESLPSTGDASSDDGACESPPVSFEELDFELELALGRRTTIQAADRLLRAKREVADAPALLLPRNKPFH